MKTTTFIIIVFSMIIDFNSFAQHSLYSLEIQGGGNAPILGFKANRYFWINDKSHLTLGAGLGWVKNITLMNDLTYSVGDGRNFFETGVIGVYSNDEYIEKQPIKYVLAPLFGYKYLSPKKDIFRFHFTPMFADGTVYFWGGISLGLQLKRKYQEKQNIGSVRFATK